jgi:hypothetical protein
MKREELKELLRAALYEGPTKRANKEKKNLLHVKKGAAERRSWDKGTTDLKLGRTRGVAPQTAYGPGVPAMRGDFGSASKGASDARRLATGRSGGQYAINRDKYYPGNLSHDMDTGREMTRSAARRADAGFGAKNAVAPAQVQAAVQSGGKVVFGRYYDAQGNYLGRSQGGQWIDGKSDPNAKTQLEMYNKLMEIESGKYTSKDRELVKEMIREIVKSCS